MNGGGFSGKELWVAIMGTGYPARPDDGQNGNLTPSA
jgi:hypothetical protein